MRGSRWYAVPAGISHEGGCAGRQAKKGDYESDLIPAVTSLLQFLSARAPTTFINLGCADSYYAVGVGRAVPGVTIEAFDLAASARRATSALAQANRVSVKLHAGASARAVRKLAPSTAGLLRDIEGAELDVLSPPVVWQLARAFVVVEIHEGLRPGVQAALLKRFSTTHDMELVEPTQHELGDRPLGVAEMANL
jgi:hypothetical protein